MAQYRSIFKFVKKVSIIFLIKVTQNFQIPKKKQKLIILSIMNLKFYFDVTFINIKALQELLREKKSA